MAGCSSHPPRAATRILTWSSRSFVPCTESPVVLARFISLSPNGSNCRASRQPASRTQSGCVRQVASMKTI
eukprot:1660593-Rhodomonas_salina.1